MPKKLLSRSLTSALLLACLPMAAIANDRMYGAGAPFTEEDLPPGQLRSALQSLPPTAKAKALHWLNSFSFPAADVDSIHVDSDGGVYYVDTETPDLAEVEGASAEPGTEAITAAEAFTLHSKPGASKVIYLDFNGHVITGTAWNNNRADPLYAKPFDTDGSPSTFSAAELNAIAEMWHRIAEDFVAFDVDVTTEEPAVFGPTTGRLLITDDEDEYGNAMPSKGAGGVAYVGVFGASYYQNYSPALVYADNLGPDFPPFIAEAASHEMGHNLGLSHDGTSTSGYYGGHGSGWVNWGPIMGTGYRDNVSQWSKGEYPDANNQQDDVALIIGKLAERGDDHGDTLAAASLLSVAADGSVSSTNPENDPFNTSPSNKGVIGSSSDVDTFVMTVGSGTVSLTVTPSWAAYPRSSNGRGTNLDVSISLFDGSGNLVASADPLDETNASLSANVAAGTYYLQVTGVGNSVSPYTDYGSHGQYFISGQVPTADPDTQAPTPNPMSWAVAPGATGPNSMAMTATTANDDSGSVQYLFHCVSGGAGCADSGWQASSSYSASGLDAATEYSWQVKARDPSGNETAYSASASATTDSAPQPPAAPTGFAVADGTDGTAVLSWTDVADNETGYEITRETWHTKRKRWQSATVLTTGADATGYTDAVGSGTYRYQVQAVNAQGGSGYTAWAEVTVTDGSGGGGKGGGGGDGSCKGGPKKCP